MLYNIVTSEPLTVMFFGAEAAERLKSRTPTSDPATHFNDTLQELLNYHAPCNHTLPS